MPLGPDGSYSGASRIYTKQQPAGLTLNGNIIITEEVIDVGGLTNQYGLQALNGVILPQRAAITAAPGAATVTNVTIQLQDNGGQNVANQPCDFDIVMSDSPFGVGVTATVPSGGMTVTAGTQFASYVTNKAIYAQSDATGKVVLQITDAARTQYYVMTQTPNGTPTVKQILTANFG